MAYKRSYGKKKGKGKGDSVWPANKSVGECGLSGISIRGKDRYATPKDLGKAGPDEAHGCLFLKVEGDQAEPSRQIIGRVKAGTDSVEQVSADGRVFRSVPTGRHRCKRNVCQAEYSYWQRFCSEKLEDGKVCRAPTGAIFKWQEGRPTGDVDASGEPVMRWHDVVVWEKVVIAEEALKRGFHVPTLSNGKFRETEAMIGDRTTGHAHSVSAVPESPMVDVARAAMSDEELGLPPVEEEKPQGDEEGLSQDDLDFLSSL